jgi:hypothetical protein
MDNSEDVVNPPERFEHDRNPTAEKTLRWLKPKRSAISLDEADAQDQAFVKKYRRYDTESK